MPELPDVTVYVERLNALVKGTSLAGIRISSPFLLRSVAPTPSDIENRTVNAVSRLGKRIVFELDDQYCVIIHLMIAGRLRWRPPAAAIPKRVGLAAFDFPHGSLLFTEAGSTKRASLHIARRVDLPEHDRGGLEILSCSLQDFSKALVTENRTLKRTLTNPRTFSGIGNAYSDEILHRARLSPLQLTRNLTSDEISRLHEATVETMSTWIDRLRRETSDGFPEKVTAFRSEMAVHGKYNQPCPVCGARVQRIVYARHEVNYCARCQTGGRLLADRAFSKILKDDWPRTLDEWED
jgi:formamidopyrimidine-DNA glycosylase